MNDNFSNNGSKNGVVRWPALLTLISILSVIHLSAIGYLGTLTIQAHNNTIALKERAAARVDPFTGKEGGALTDAVKELKDEVNALNTIVTELRIEVAQLPPDYIEDRIEQLEHAEIRRNPDFVVPSRKSK